MKAKTFFIPLIISCFALMLGACSHKDDNDLDPDNGRIIEISCNSFFEKIGSHNLDFTATQISNDFQSEVTKGEKYRVSISKDGVSFTSNKQEYFLIPADQTQCTSNGIQVVVTLENSKAVMNLTYKHEEDFFKLTVYVPGTVKQATLEHHSE